MRLWILDICLPYIRAILSLSQALSDHFTSSRIYENEKKVSLTTRPETVLDDSVVVETCLMLPLLCVVVLCFVLVL